MVNVYGKDRSFMRNLFPIGYMAKSSFRSVDTLDIQTRFYVVFPDNPAPMFVSCIEEMTRLKAVLVGYDVEILPSAYRPNAGASLTDYYYAIKRRTRPDTENTYDRP